MDAEALLEAWRRILPASVSVWAAPFAQTAAPLSAAERRSAGDIDVGRRRELENGRQVAKRALAALGVAASDLPIGKDRAPQWPEGIVGSLSHAGSYVAAAVARSSAVAALGIDVEVDGGLDPRLWGGFLNAPEQARLLSVSPALRSAEAKLLWCIKEAAIKAARRRVEPPEIEVEPESSSEGVALWRIGFGIATAGRPCWHGRSIRSQGFVLAAVTVEAIPLPEETASSA
jgi:4'-phosphopantetheinyl transferase EntD